MTTRPTEPPDMPDDNQSETLATPEGDNETLATPEGDNEYTPDEPFPPTEPTPIRPRDEPHTAEPLRPALD